MPDQGSRSVIAADPPGRRARASVRLRVGVFGGSLCCVGLGVALMVRARLGVAPNDVMNTGVAHQLGMGVGTASWITSGVAIALGWSLGRPPRAATLVGGLLVGFAINGAIAALPAPDLIVARSAMLALGLLFVWVGITGIVSADIGVGPIELVMLGIMDRGVSVRVARWGLELSLVTIGLLLGGAAGVGTALFAFGAGPALAFTLPRATARLGTDLRRPT